MINDLSATRQQRSNLGSVLKSLFLGQADWRKWISICLTLGLFIAVVWNLSVVGIDRSWQAIPHNPLFWAVFACWYLALPFSEWLIYSRLWKLPASGFAELLRKLVSNELLLGYSGEVSFYNWARGHTNMAAAPFGTIKDVSILSALAGNLVTLVLLGVSWIAGGRWLQRAVAAFPHAGTLIIAAMVILGVSLAVLVYRNKVFSLPAPELRRIFAIHIVRLVVVTGLSALMWHLALPGLSIMPLLAAAALQLLVMRLPFISNKEILFAGLAMMVLGQNNQLALVLGMIATLTMVTHMIIGLTLSLASLINGRLSGRSETPL